MATVDTELFKLEDLSYASMKNVANLASAINKSKETLIGLGYICSDAYYIHILFKALGAPYASLAREIRQQDIKKLTLSDCISQAHTEEVSIKQQDTTSSSTTASAMNTSKGKGKGKGNNKAKDTQSSDKKKPQGSRFHCDNCGPKSFHPSATCWTLHPELKPKDRDQGKQQDKQQANQQQQNNSADSATTKFSNLQFDDLPEAVKKQF
ncbi:hypothetical protein GJ744_008856 [Endocarpon pusillum]|uniref:Uncharacterized protein n=1 Tax=Endocarpon pusillum TaxID=364733 RepID=A0A8H7AV90_9EURO|nr:hypothetical protein GJ744_008856 [Endocarpon pusillum]